MGDPGVPWCLEQRQAKYLEHKLKCTKARNEYLLSLASVNAAISNYYLHDILDLMDVSFVWASRWGHGNWSINAWNP